MSDFHRASLEMAWLRLCRITNESTEIENCYSGLNRELLGCGTQYSKTRVYRDMYYFLTFVLNHTCRS